MKPFEYGLRVFLITFCFVMVSGYGSKDFAHSAICRILMIALGAVVGLGVNLLIYPIWAGEDLHNLVGDHFFGVAESLEGCVNGYLRCVEYERVALETLASRAPDDPLCSGYRSAIESTSKEDRLLGFALWEPPHGRYKGMDYPWRSYPKVGGALRHCAIMVMALHGCILSEIQARPELRLIFGGEFQRVGNEGARVLRAMGRSMRSMRKLNHPKTILHRAHEAARRLQVKVDRMSYLLVNSEHWEMAGDGAEDEEEAAASSRRLAMRSFGSIESLISPRIGSSEAILGNKPASWPRQPFCAADVLGGASAATYESASALSLATFASLLIEFVARLQNLVDEFDDLSAKAAFEEETEEEEEDGGMSTSCGGGSWV